jgi:hypothetical protein
MQPAVKATQIAIRRPVRIAYEDTLAIGPAVQAPAVGGMKNF